MANDRFAGHVVVGTDGSRAASRAVEVAAGAAALRGLKLTLLLAVPPARTPTSQLGGETLVAGLSERGRSVLDELAGRLQASHPTLAISTDLVIADAAAALVEASRSAVLVVVGARGRNASLVSQILGGTADIVVTHAESPVLVVPETAEVGATGPVVVGMDESAESLAALRPAFESADLRGVPLLAVCAWDLHPADVEFFDETGLASLEAAVAASVAAVAPEFPGVTSETVLERGRPASILLAESERASLLVVGSRGLGGFRGLLLGSVSREVTRSAKCPVLVVRKR